MVKANRRLTDYGYRGRGLATSGWRLEFDSGGCANSTPDGEFLSLLAVMNYVRDIIPFCRSWSSMTVIC